MIFQFVACRVRPSVHKSYVLGLCFAGMHPRLGRFTLGKAVPAQDKVIVMLVGISKTILPKDPQGL